MNIKLKLFFLLLVIIMTNKVASAYFTVDDVRYTNVSGGTTVYVSGRATTQLLELVIPHEVVYSNITYKVEGIGASIFNGSPANLRHIVLSEGIEYIGNDSFKNNKQLN